MSALAHFCLLGLVLSLPRPHGALRPHAVSVELVALPPGGAAPKARAVPAEVPEPKPPPLPAKPKEVLLPARPRGPKPKPKPHREEIFRPPEPKQEKSLEDLLAEMREDAGEQPQAQPERTASAPSPEAGAGGGVVVSAAVRDWMVRVKRHVQRSWVVPPGFRKQALATHVMITLDAAGNVVNTRIERRSGNPWYDEGVVRGITKASPLPPPPEPGDWPFIFAPEDSL